MKTIEKGRSVYVHGVFGSRVGAKVMESAGGVWCEMKAIVSSSVTV